jgi:hypothetical protein
MEIKTLPVTTKRISEHFGITPDQHIEMFFDYGYDFLLKQQDDTEPQIDPNQLEALKRYTRVFVMSPIFWCWWKVEWERTDQYFMRKGIHDFWLYVHAQRKTPRVPNQKDIEMILKLAVNNKKVQKLMTKVQ